MLNQSRLKNTYTLLREGMQRKLLFNKSILLFLVFSIFTSYLFCQETRSRFIQNQVTDTTAMARAQVNGLETFCTGSLTAKMSSIDQFFRFKNSFKPTKTFALNSKWSDISGMFNEIEYNQFSEVKFDRGYINSTSFKIFVKKQVDTVSGIQFDDEFLLLERNLFFSETFYLFVKYFESPVDSKKYFDNTKKNFFDKGVLDNECTSITAYPKGVRYVSYEVQGNNVFFIVSAQAPDEYWESLFYTYSLSKRTNQFIEIDSSQSFRGIKFGTKLTDISNKAALKKSEYSTFQFSPSNKFYLIWKNFSIKEGNVIFNFSQDYRLASVELYLDYSEYNIDEVLKLMRFQFGNPSLDESLKKISNDSIIVKKYTWIGDNIILILYNDPSDIFGTSITIKSNYLKASREVDY